MKKSLIAAALLSLALAACNKGADTAAPTASGASETAASAASSATGAASAASSATEAASAANTAASAANTAAEAAVLAAEAAVLAAQLLLLPLLLQNNIFTVKKAGYGLYPAFLFFRRPLPFFAPLIHYIIPVHI